MQPVYLICGVSGCGKSWVCRQLTEKFHYVAHDRCWVHPTKPTPKEGTVDPEWVAGAKSVHVPMVIEAAKKATKPVITECPFAEREVREGLEKAGIKVIPVFVIEKPAIVAARYLKREGKALPKAAFTRASTIKDRAAEWNAVGGTSSQVFDYLRGLVI